MVYFSDVSWLGLMLLGAAAYLFLVSSEYFRLVKLGLAVGSAGVKDEESAEMEKFDVEWQLGGLFPRVVHAKDVTRPLLSTSWQGKEEKDVTVAWSDRRVDGSRMDAGVASMETTLYRRQPSVDVTKD